MQNFNSYDAVKKLTEVGVPEQQASEIINAILNSKETETGKPATKEPDNKLEQGITLVTKDIEILKDQVASKFEISELKTDLIEQNSAIKQEIASVKEQIKLEIINFRDEIKQEVSSFKNEIKNEISNTKQEVIAVKSEISVIKSDILKWITPLFIGIIASIIASILFKKYS